MAKDLKSVKNIIFICNGGSCLKKGAEENTNLLRQQIKDCKVEDSVHTIKTRCCGQCEHGPVVFVQPDDIWYKDVTEEVSKAIITQHIVRNAPLAANLLYGAIKVRGNFVSRLFGKLQTGFLKAFLFLLFFLVVSHFLTAQNSTLSGTVKDVETGEPLPAVYVVVNPGGIATVSNKQGDFLIGSLSQGTYELEMSGFGVRKMSKEVTIAENENKIIIVFLDSDILNLPEVTIRSSTIRSGENSLDKISLELQPINSAQDLLRAVPGLFIAQHAGGGKAEQIFVRGTDNDHGTDFAVFWDGIPVNMPSHAHGQGYADMHFIIPEVVGNASFYKGPYDARFGDFSITGVGQFNSRFRLDKNLAKVEYGMFNSQRYLVMANILDKKHAVKSWKDNAYLAADYTYTDGFFRNKINLNRFNLFGRYNARLTANTSLILTGSGFASDWNASGQIPLRAVESGLIHRFGAIDNSEGGKTARYNFNLKTLTFFKDNSSFTNQVYYSKNLFSLFSNFTFFMNDTVNGDAKKQWENRNLFGYNGAYSRADSVGKTVLESEAGFSSRTDQLQVALFNVKQRKVLDTAVSSDVLIHNFSFYINENWKFHRKWHLNVGIRNELFFFKLKDKLEMENSGAKWVYRVNPKFNIYYDIARNVTLFARAGTGFHSNYIQAVLSESATANPVPQSYGADLGSEFKLGKRTVVSVAAWWLRMGSEYKFIADDPSFEDIGDSRKHGLDLSIRTQVIENVWTDVHVNYAKAVLLSASESENLLPFFPTWNSTGGITAKFHKGISGSIRYRYMGPRPATEDGSVIAEDYFIMDAVVKYQCRRFETGLTIENILNTQWMEAQFYDSSRLQHEDEPVDDFHFTPGTPFFLKANFTYYFNR